MADPATYKYHVGYSCSGCSNAVKKVLTRAKDKNEIQDFKVSLAGKSATVTATGKSLADVQEIVAKPGKATEPWVEWAARNADEAALLEAAEAAESAEAAVE